MKKIGLWMAALTAVTVGGVYAQFVYSDSNDIQAVWDETSIKIGEASQDGAAGTFSVNADNFFLTIDSAATVLADELGDTNAHKAMMVAKGEIVITFTPDKDLMETDILNNGVHASVYFEASFTPDNWTYDFGGVSNKVIKSFNTSAFEIHQADETGKTVWKKETDGSFTYTIKAEDLFKKADTDMLVMEDVVLETIEEYNAFSASFTGKTVTVRVAPNAGNDMVRE